MAAFSILIGSFSATARRLGLQLHVLHASTERDFDSVFATLAQLRAGGLVIAGDTLFTSRTNELAVPLALFGRADEVIDQ